MRYIVTGGAGFIGSNLTSELLARGHQVIVIDNFVSGKDRNLEMHKGDINLKIIRKDITEDLSEAFKDSVDGVFHLAALPRVQFSIQYPIETNHTNVTGTLNLLEHCRKYGVQRFVFSSSSSVYGAQDRMPLVESMIPRPISPYALHKFVGEHYCRLYHHIHKMKTVSLRYFNVYGPRQYAEGAYALVIPKFTDRMLRGEVPSIHGDGANTRDYTFVGDVIKANLLASSTENKEIFGTEFNIGAGRGLSVNEVVKAIKTELRSDITPTHGPAVVEPPHTLANTNQAKNLLGWIPEMRFEDGLKITIKDMTDRPEYQKFLK